MYAIINPHCRNYLDTQDFYVVSRHRNINRAADRYDPRKNVLVEMDGARAIRKIGDFGAEPGYDPCS